MGNKKKNRNYYIDNIRGLATISVVFIHTVFWSGSSYVPEYMRNLSLLIDVPIFFLLTGMLMSVVKNINPIKQVTKLIFSFFILVLAYQILFMDIQDYKFPVGIPYVVASMISLFLILHFFHKSTFLNLKIPILSFVGCNSLYFYMSQGIGVSILFYILPFLKFSWQLKMIFAFIINIIASLIIGYLFIWFEKQFNKIIRRGNLNVES